MTQSMKVSTVLLFFLSLLLHDVFSQLALDDNCTITNGPFHIPRVPRIGCTAQSCLSCREAKAECFHNTTSNTFTCTADTSTCSIQVCEPCQYCIGSFTSPSTSQNFTLNSLCFELPQDKTCQEAKAAEWCALNGTISSADDIFMSSAVVVNRDSIHLNCRCYGENCTEHLLYTYSILPTSPPTFELEAVVTMETGSVLVTPTVSFQMTPTTSFLVTPTPDIGVGNGPVPTSPYIIAISVIAAVLLVLVIVVIILCAIKLFHPHHNPTQTSRQDFKF